MEKVHAYDLKMTINSIRGNGNIVSWEENGKRNYALAGPVYPILDDVDLGDDCYGADAIDLDGTRYLVKWYLMYTLDERFDEKIEIEALSSWTQPEYLYRL